MSIEQTEATIRRGKTNKPGKVISLSMIWVCAIVLIVILVIQVISMVTLKSASNANREVATYQAAPLQPSAAKIVSADTESIVTSETPSNYTDVWNKLDRMAPRNATEKERLEIIAMFLAGLNYQMTEYHGIIVTVDSQTPVSPDTIECYINGYIPDKPYLKANCPAI